MAVGNRGAVGLYELGPITGNAHNSGNQVIGDPGALMMWGPYHSAFIPAPDKWANLCFDCAFSGEGFVIEYED